MTTLTPSRSRTTAPAAARAPRTAARRGITPQDLLRFAFVSDPKVAPDGRAVVFVRKEIGEKNEYLNNLWMVRRAGSSGWEQPRQFTSGNKDAHPRWSPQGDRIAFIAERKKGHAQIHVIP